MLSGLLLTLPFLNFSLAPLAWIGLVPLILVVTGRPVREGAMLGFITGAVFGYGGMYWLSRVTIAGYGVLGLYLALYPALWAGWISWMATRRPGWIWWAAPASWTALEYLRTYLFTGFPWNLMGISQARNLSLIQIASVTGVYGVSFLVVLVNTSVASWLLFFQTGRERRGRKILRWLPTLVTVLLILAALGYGRRILKAPQEASPRSEPLAVTLIQGGIIQELKWDPSRAADHFETYLDLTRKSLESAPGLVIWPESSLPYYLEDQPVIQRLLSDLVVEGRTYLLLGGDYRSAATPPRYYNSAYLFSPEGHEWKRYDKIHLVPFGEYTPLKRFFPFLGHVVPWEEDFSAGERSALFKLDKPAGRRSGILKLGVLICFEDIFPGLVREMVRGGAGLLVNITNDAWYGRTIAPFQHAYAAIFRAVENRVYLARSTNTGYSCVISPRGEVVGEVVDDKGEVLFVSDWCTVEISPTPSGSFYTEQGDLFSWICVGLTFLASLGCLIFPDRRIFYC